ncbi:YdcF family protein [Sulfuritalea sp.]|uniref:YdcF family protein n=1 Tax=Sulfuritalea sp. TaxID=2480090 RepID=UPI001AD0FE33|nr:YdcF family protein [Sulfuritalea sp.]MBN8473741.1 YdcF family protein [Sulfuritalea sp.]
MFRISLFQRRQIWLPSAFGWLVLIAFAGAAALLAGFRAYPFLAPNDPVPGARLLVVEGWLASGEFDQAVEAYRKGRYDRVVTTGGPIDRFPELLGASNYADFAARYLKSQGLSGSEVIPVPTPASALDRTYQSAAALRDWADKPGSGIVSLDVFSSGTHARRSRALYRMAFGPTIDIGVLAARPTEYDPEQWWQTSAGAKAVVGESIALIWTTCCFHPPALNSHDN